MKLILLLALILVSPLKASACAEGASDTKNFGDWMKSYEEYYAERSLAFEGSTLLPSVETLLNDNSRLVNELLAVATQSSSEAELRSNFLNQLRLERTAFLIRVSDDESFDFDNSKTITLLMRQAREVRVSSLTRYKANQYN